MRKFDRFLIATMFIFLFICVGINNYQINKISEVYFNQSIIESIDALNYIPTKLINANVKVSTKEGAGSGVIIKVDNKATYVLTAAHVIYEKHILLIQNNKLEKSGKISKNITVEIEKIKYKAITVKIDKKLDIALIKIYKKIKISPVKIAKEQPKLGETVWAISNPNSLTDLVNTGVFSSIEKKYNVVSVAGYFGSSGGMVLNDRGELIGIISVVYSTEMLGYFPNIVPYNGITKTKDLNKFLKDIL